MANNSIINIIDLTGEPEPVEQKPMKRSREETKEGPPKKKKRTTPSKEKKKKEIKSLMTRIHRNVNKRGYVINEELHQQFTTELAKKMCDDELSNFRLSSNSDYYLIDAAIEALNTRFEKEMAKKEVEWAGNKQEHGAKASIAAQIFFKCMKKMPLALTSGVETPTQEGVKDASADVDDDPSTRWSVPMLYNVESPNMGYIPAFEYSMGMAWTSGIKELLKKWNVNADCTLGLYESGKYMEGREIVFSEDY